MKNINKALTMLIATMLISTAMVSADDSRVLTTSSSGSITGSWMHTGSGMYMKKLREAKEDSKILKDELKKTREELKEEVKTKKDEIKTNREEFKENSWDLKDILSDISDEQKEELKTLRDAHRATVEDIKEQLKNKELTSDEREELRNQLDEETTSYAEDVKEVIGDDAEASSYVDSRLELRNKNSEIRDEIRETRVETRGEMADMIETYKEAYFSKLATVVPKLATEKLEKLSTKVDTMIEKVEANTKLSQDKKDKLVAQLVSLKEIIDEELETRDILDEDLDLEEIID